METNVKNNRSAKLTLLSSLFVFLFVFLTHAASPVTTAFDSAWTTHVAMSILEEGNTDLDEYESIFFSPDDYHFEYINGHYYYFFPVGTSVAVVPLLFLAEQAAFLVGFDLADHFAKNPPAIFDQHAVLGRLERVLASLFVALATAVMYLVARRFLDLRSAFLIAIIFAFCTSIWSTASRGLWQHGPSALMLTIALYLIVKAKDNPRLVPFVSLPLALAYVIRPTNSLSIVVFSLYILFRYRRYFLQYCLWFLPIAIPFVLYSSIIYNSILPTYFAPDRVGYHYRFASALIGNLVSPARGLFVFSPILLLSIVGLAVALYKRWQPELHLAAAAIIVLHWISISSYDHWYAGWAIGPRLFTDMIPYLIFLLIPVIRTLQQKPPLQWRVTLGGALLILCAVSFLIHFRCATDEACVQWNWEPNAIDTHNERLWDWSDLQFLRQKQ